MSPLGPSVEAATPAGILLVLALVVPVSGALLAFLFGGRGLERVASLTIALGVGVAAAIALVFLRSDHPLVYLLGGWAPPLGVVLRADGPAAVMMAITAVVIGAVGIFARADFHT